MLTPSPWCKMLLGAAFADDGKYDLKEVCPKCSENLGWFPPQRCPNCNSNLRFDGFYLFYVENPYEKD